MVWCILCCGVRACLVCHGTSAVGDRRGCGGVCIEVKELGPEHMSLLEMCSHFSGCNVQASVELGSRFVGY